MNIYKIRYFLKGVSFPLEFTTWAWVQATTGTAMGKGLLVPSPIHKNSKLSLPRIHHDPLICIHLHMSTNRKNWVGHCHNGNWRWQLPLIAIPALAWTQVQVVNSNSTSAVQDPPLHCIWIQFFWSFKAELECHKISKGNTRREISYQ